ncbi:MAG: hypothetical protein IJG23_04555 [Clostridia bacterium]|nr:hypothetical protein [Clostridia bacterium]
MEKKKKILIIILIVCLVLAAGGITTAVLLRKKSADNGTTAAVQSTTAATAQKSGKSIGEEYVKEEYKEDYKNISSSGIKGDPDGKVKANFYNLAKAASPELQMKNFDLLKVYEGFRFYDTTGTTDADGTKSYIVVVYVENGKAVIVEYNTYENTDERANLLTSYIQQMDKEYEQIAARVKAKEDAIVLYE